MQCALCNNYIRRDAWKTSHTGGEQWMHLKCCEDFNYEWGIAVRRKNGISERWTKIKEQQ